MKTNFGTGVATAAIALVAASILIGLTGCREDGHLTRSTTISDSTLPAGWKRVVDDGRDLSIGLAPGWKAADLTQRDLHTISTRMKSPDDRAGVEEIARKRSIKFALVHVEGSVHSNVQVVVFPIPNSVSANEMIDRNVDTLRRTMGFTGKLRSEHLALGDATVIRMLRTVKIGGSPMQVLVQGYFVVKHSEMYAIMGVTPSEGALPQQVDEMAKSFNEQAS